MKVENKVENFFKKTKSNISKIEFSFCFQSGAGGGT